MDSTITYPLSNCTCIYCSSLGSASGAFALSPSPVWRARIWWGAIQKKRSPEKFCLTYCLKRPILGFEFTGGFMNPIAHSLSPAIFCKPLSVYILTTVTVAAVGGLARARNEADSAAPSQGAPAFFDRFDAGELDTSKWDIARYKSPDSKPGINAGYYTPATLDFSSGMLRIAVDQTETNDGVHSSGGAIISKGRFGYGTYEFVMRMTSPSPSPGGQGNAKTGAVSSGFLYRTNSETEIDLEFVGDQNAMWVTSWDNPSPSQPPTRNMKQSERLPNGDLATGFHTYTLVWESARIRVFIDGAIATTLTRRIPSAPAHIILQHRGTNSDKWGGVAAIGVTRYAYFRSVKFTPMAER